MLSLKHSSIIRFIVSILTITLIWTQVTPAWAMGVQIGRNNSRNEKFRREYLKHMWDLPNGMTQTLTPEQLRKVEAKKAANLQHKATMDAKMQKAQPAVQILSVSEMKKLTGRGPYRNASYAGSFPWQRSFHDVNVCTGNLMKSFTDMQVSPARGAGLVLQRTYNSQETRVGAFGLGWNHAYDIHVEDTGDNNVKTCGFFGSKNTYHRDADGLYTPPAYMYDELSSQYDYALVNGPAITHDFTDRGMDGTVKHYFKNGSVFSCDTITDRHNNQTVLTYDQNITLPDGGHPLKTVTDPSGRSLAFTWTNFGTTQSPVWRITQVQGPLVNNAPVTNVTYRVTYEYYTDTNDPNAADNLYNLKAVHLDPDGLNRTTSYTYTHVTGTNGTENGLLNSITDPANNNITYTYTTAYNVRLDDAGGIQTRTGNTATNTVWVYQINESAGIDLNSSTRRITWTIVSEINGSNGHNRYITNSAGIANVNGFVIGLKTDPYGRFISIDNDKANNDYAYIGYDATLYSLQYDNSNNITLKDTISVDNYFNESGLPAVPKEVWENYSYGQHGNVLTHNYQDSTPQDTSSYYNASQYFKPVSQTDMNGHTSYFGVGSSQGAIGNRGETLWVRDARYSATQTQYAYQYNDYGQKTSEINQNGVKTQFFYEDQWGNLTKTIQDPGDTAAGHLNRSTIMTYDAAGHVLTSTDPNDRTTTFHYNVLGQVTEVDTPATTNTNAESITYTYGANGRTETVTDNRGTTTISYEAGSDRVHSVTDPITGTTTYTYTITGEKQTVLLPGGGTWTYYYSNPYTQTYILSKDDPNSFSLYLNKIIDDQGRVVDINTDGRGVLSRIRWNQTYANNSLAYYCDTKYYYDTYYSLRSHNWLKTIKTTWYTPNPDAGYDPHLISQNDYTYDNIGQRLTNLITDNTGAQRTETYGYDEINRLTSVNYGDGENQSYTFDPMGNRKTMTDTVSGVQTNHSYSYDAANRISTFDSNAYTYDANGNTLTGGGRTNTWDSQNRMVQCITSGNNSTFTYGADGLRRSSTVNGTTTHFALDGDNVVRELKRNSNNVLVSAATYLTGPTGPMYRRDDNSGSIRWYVYDGLGSVLAEIDPSGNVTAKDKYDVYGAVRSRTGTASTNHGFVGSLGHMSEANTGLIYMRARYYDQAVGRFISQDPGRHGSNWYVYCDNNPVNRVDKNGKEWYNPATWSWYADLITGGTMVCLGEALKDSGGPEEYLLGVGLQIIGTGLLLGGAFDAFETFAGWINKIGSPPTTAILSIGGSMIDTITEINKVTQAVDYLVCNSIDDN